MRRRLAATPAPRVTQDMTAMIYRVLAFYSLAGLLPNVPQALKQLPGTQTWAVVIFFGGIFAAAFAMIAAAVARRSIRWPAGLYALITVVFVFTAPQVMSPTTLPDDVWVFGAIGTSIVCAGVAVGGRAAVGYAAVLAVGYALLRSSEAGGSVRLLYASCSGIFAGIGGLSILAVALGMIAAANAADELAARVRRRELGQAVDRAVTEERARLDQLIHDDVMTTLVAAAHASDGSSITATAELAARTLDTIEKLQQGAQTNGALSSELFGRLAADTALRVSPEVSFRVDRREPIATLRLPSAAAEVMLSAMREAVRNAVRHSGARLVEVAFSVDQSTDGHDRVVLTVSDDGKGFDPREVPVDRLGIRLSMTESLRAVGATVELRSAPGSGTQVEITRRSERELRPDRYVVYQPPADIPRLPADFPVRRLILVTWAVAIGQIGIGAANLGRLADLPTVSAMILLCPLVAVVVHTGRDLRLPARSAAVAVVLIAAVAALTAVAAPTQLLPDIAMWQQFPVQLVLVILIIRRRPVFALLGLVAVLAVNAVWASHSPFGLSWFVGASFGATAFVIMAVLVGRVLQVIARRQYTLRAAERSALDASARRHVAVVQRALWIADLKAEARGTLTTIAQLVDEVPEQVRAEALLVEATLREALSARNVMNEELAELTEAARRRGVRVTFVDSRTSPVPNDVGKAVMAEVRDTLSSDGVSRLVVRLAPDRGGPVASVMTEDAVHTSLTVIDPAGSRESRTLPPHG